MEIIVIISLLIIVILVGILVFLILKMKDLLEVERNYSIMTKNYSTVTILQEIMSILGAKIPSGEKLIRINDILINRFNISYSTIVESTENGNIVKTSNIPKELFEQIVNLDKTKGFLEAMKQNVPKYITGIKTLEYATASERDVRSVLMFPLYREEEYRGYWILEDIRSNAFDNVEKVQLSIIRDNITLVLQNNDYALMLENKTSELEMANKKLEEMANRDGLTGAFNKAFMHKVLESVFNGNRRQNSLAIMDIDHFKNYNDQNGHMEGDNLLKGLSKLLTESLRDTDMLFRFGGEEFVILFADTAKEDAIMVAERIRQKVADYVFPFEEKQPGGNLTISVGVAFAPQDAVEKQKLLEIADERLYKAKTGGRNKVVFE
ncbi:MAG: GGDEF domain-containing protein [Clostridia bacterium]|nr:GGDEF domain-containing protein [Clostridia bacterium]